MTQPLGVDNFITVEGGEYLGQLTVREAVLDVRNSVALVRQSTVNDAVRAEPPALPFGAATNAPNGSAAPPPAELQPQLHKLLAFVELALAA